jgi:hypothetical protein
VLPFTGLTCCRGETRRQRVRHDMSSPFVRILSRALCWSWLFAVSQSSGILLCSVVVLAAELMIRTLSEASSGLLGQRFPTT